MELQENALGNILALAAKGLNEHDEEAQITPHILDFERHPRYQDEDMIYTDLVLSIAALNDRLLGLERDLVQTLEIMRGWMIRQ